MTNLFSKPKVINKVVSIEINKIIPNPAQPRLVFGENELKDLSESIKQNGILQPLTIRKNQYDEYELISGERRLKASKMAGFETVPCIIIDTDSKQSAVLSLLENIQRQNLNYFEEAIAINKLILEWGVTQEEASEKLGKAQSTIANKLRLLKLTDLEQQIILQNNLTERHARALLKLQHSHQRMEVVEYIIVNKCNVNTTEKYIEKYIDNIKNGKPNKKRIPIIKDVRLFLNTINKALETMKLSGINASSVKKQGDDFIEYVVRIPINT